jgi:hypothetical protein
MAFIMMFAEQYHVQDAQGEGDTKGSSDAQPQPIDPGTRTWNSPKTWFGDMVWGESGCRLLNEMVKMAFKTRENFLEWHVP